MNNVSCVTVIFLNKQYMQENELEIYIRAMDQVAHILLTDGQGTITYVNDKYCSLSRYSRDELVGQNNRIFKSDYHSPEFFKNMYIELNKGNIFKAKFKNIAKDGSFFWMDATIIPFLDQDNVPYQFLAIRFDITDKINEVAFKEEFLADISHEIRTPLHGLLSMVDILSETPLNKAQKECINHIKETSDHLGHLVNDLLDIFKIDSGKLQFELIPINIRQLVISMVEILSLNEKKFRIKFIHSIDENIQGTFLGDPTRLRQILFNLLGNALKFTEKGSITVDVQMIGEVDDYQFLEFKITDTGIGIPLDKQEAIFDKFIQSDVKDTRLYGGTGMGMNIVKNLIQLQDGCFSLKSVEGEGTTFQFTLPYKKMAQQPDQLPEIQSIISPDKHHTKLNILIAEDEKLNQLIYKKQMSKFNHNYRIAENGYEAIEILQQENFDLILLDMQMPGMNGDEVLTKIRGEMPEPLRSIPVICVSATVNTNTIEALQKAGANGYLTKPYKEIELADIIRKTISETIQDQASPRIDIQSNQTRYVNLETLDQFAGGDIDFIIEILEYFNATTPEVLESMQQNFASKSIELTRQLHKYRSQVSLLGITELSELSMQLEAALIETEDFELYSDDFEQILLQSKGIVTEINFLITELKTNNEI